MVRGAGSLLGASILLLCALAVHAWPVFIEPEGGVNVETMYNGTLSLAPHGSGHVQVAKDLHMAPGYGIVLETNATSVTLDSTILRTLLDTVDLLTETVSALVENANNSNEVVNYTMASTAALQVGDVSSYVLNATGALQLTTSHPQRPFHTLVNDDQAVLVALSETLFLIFFQDAANQNYGTVVAGQVSAAGAVQLSDPADVFAAESVHYLRAAKLSDTKFVVVFNGKAVLGTFLPAVNFDDRSFSLSTAVAFAAVSSTVSYDAQSMQVVGFSETKFVVCYTKLTMPNADAGAGVAYVGTAAGASISFSAEQTYESTAGSFLYNASPVSTSEFLLEIREAGGAGVAKVGTVGGSGSTATIAFSVRHEFDSGMDQTYNVRSTKLTPSTSVVAYRDVGDAFSGVVRIVTVSGASVQFSTQFQFANNVHRIVALIALDDTHFAVAFQRTHTSATVAAVTGTVDAVQNTLTFSSAYQFQQVTTVDVLSPAITAGVYGGYLHLWYRNADGILVSPRTLGIVSAVDGTTAEVTVSGTVQVRADVALAPGTFYFADAAGSLTAEDTGFPAGLAVSTTNLLVRGNRFDAALGGGGGGGDASSFGAGVATSSALYPGEVRAMAGTRLPVGWLTCDGSNVSRITYADLFQAIGTTWGGSDSTTGMFTLPDLRGRSLLGTGTGTSLTARDVGDYMGSETTTLTSARADGSRLYVDGKTTFSVNYRTGIYTLAAHSTPVNTMHPAAVVTYMIKT
jgi:microcystin-dependent protein